MEHESGRWKTTNNDVNGIYLYLEDFVNEDAPMALAVQNLKSINITFGMRSSHQISAKMKSRDIT